MTLNKLRLSTDVFARLMPMHLCLDGQGRARSVGRTAAKFIATGSQFKFDWQIRTGDGAMADMEALCAAVDRGARLFLQLKGSHDEWRGHGVLLDDQGLLLNFGFGIGLRDAVRRVGLTDADFAPSELAMELLFLQEANGTVMDELSRYNLTLEKARQEAEWQAMSDPLTGLSNRRALKEILDKSVEEALHADRSFAILHVDLDLFKQVNDQHGHAAGDMVLQNVARILRSAVRGDDTVARIGGDEFVVLLPGLVSKDILSNLARRLIAEIEQPVIVGEATCRVSVSIGIALSTDYALPDSDVMTADADRALYEAKNMGRSRACFALGNHDRAMP